jgi:hypothetical protein
LQHPEYRKPLLIILVLIVEVPLLDAVVDVVELLHKGIELFLLLAEGGLMSEDARLPLAGYSSSWLGDSSSPYHCHFP